MKVRLSEIPAGTCFLQGKKTKKKVEGDRIATMNGKRVKYRKQRGDPAVQPVPCPLRYFGVGLRRHPEHVVEIGDGNLLKERRNQS